MPMRACRVCSGGGDGVGPSVGEARLSGAVTDELPRIGDRVRFAVTLAPRHVATLLRNFVLAAALVYGPRHRARRGRRELDPTTAEALQAQLDDLHAPPTGALRA